MQNMEILDHFEKVLEEGLLKVCKTAGLLADEILSSPDIDDKWDIYIKDYVGDAVENFNEYPDAAIAWAGFLGMGVAHNWDTDWEAHRDDFYESYYGPRGWDDMDEHIMRDLLGLSEEDEKHFSATLNSCAAATLGLIRHEGVEPQTADGFYILVRAYSLLYRIGAAIELQRLGYKKQALYS